MRLNITPRLIFALSVLAAFPFVLSACAPVDDETVAENLPPANIDETPPDIAPAEMIPFIDNPQSEIWRPGYWAMIHATFVWVPGQILSRPSPTAIWAPARWVHHTYGWSFEQGHWE
jgi:hypothetical protein